MNKLFYLSDIVYCVFYSSRLHGLSVRFIFTFSTMYLNGVWRLISGHIEAKPCKLERSSTTVHVTDAMLNDFRSPLGIRTFWIKCMVIFPSNSLPEAR